MFITTCAPGRVHYIIIGIILLSSSYCSTPNRNRPISVKTIYHSTDTVVSHSRGGTRNVWVFTPRYVPSVFSTRNVAPDHHRETFHRKWCVYTVDILGVELFYRIVENNREKIEKHFDRD